MARWVKSDDPQGKSPKYKAGTRHFGKGIAKAPRGLILAPDTDQTAAVLFKNQKEKRYRMYLNAYENALKTGDKRRLRGVRAMGIIVHAEKIDPTWRTKIDLTNKEIKTIDDLARMAHDHFVAAQENAAHLIFVKGNKIISYTSFPKGYPQSVSSNFQALQDNVIKNIGKTKPPETDGYYIVENNPNAKLNDSDIKLHQSIAQNMDGYLGGILIKPGFDYGLVAVKNSQIEIEERQLPLPTPDTQQIQGYEGPYTVLDNHQDLIGHAIGHAADEDAIYEANISKIANRVERARDTTLLIYTDKGKTTGIQEVPNPLLKKAKKFDDFLTEQMQKYSADQTIAVIDPAKAAIAKPTAKRTIKKIGIDFKVATRDATTKLIKMVNLKDWGISHLKESGHEPHG